MGNILSKLPHTRPYRIYHRVLKSKDILPAPWGSRFRSLMKAVSLLTTCPGPHSKSVSGIGIRKQNLYPCFVQPLSEYGPLRSRLRDKMPYHGGPLYVSSQLRKLGWEKSSSRAKDLALFNPTSPLLERSGRVPCTALQSAGSILGKPFQPRKYHAGCAILDGLRSESKVIG